MTWSSGREDFLSCQPQRVLVRGIDGKAYLVHHGMTVRVIVFQGEAACRTLAG